MRRITILLFIAILTFVAVLYVKRPDILNHVWIWVIGLAAPIIGLFKHLIGYFRNWFDETILKKGKVAGKNPVNQIKQ